MEAETRSGSSGSG